MVTESHQFGDGCCPSVKGDASRHVTKLRASTQLMFDTWRSSARELHCPRVELFTWSFVNWTDLYGSLLPASDLPFALHQLSGCRCYTEQMCPALLHSFSTMYRDTGLTLLAGCVYLFHKISFETAQTRKLLNNRMPKQSKDVQKWIPNLV
jgi:hypothetical protein